MFKKTAIALAATSMLAAATILSGCATTYSEMGAMGGVMAAPVTNDVYRISARGNGYTDATTIQDYVLLKASETTIAAGKTHFEVINNRDATSNVTQQTAGTFGRGLFGGVSYSPGFNYEIVKPGEDLMIRVSNASGPNSYNAQEVFNNINPRVKRPKG
ncbi:CC0125/CC1285 family lipoprotein [Devosia sp. XGJD_8]|uniref:CC0125/CC1285 family lipoprotein n=1 Tax=Devosia sp. XGJD_8 TaxID=3391187 RepID=UPI0039850A07